MENVEPPGASRTTPWRPRSSPSEPPARRRASQVGPQSESGFGAGHRRRAHVHRCLLPLTPVLDIGSDVNAGVQILMNSYIYSLTPWLHPRALALPSRILGPHSKPTVVKVGALYFQGAAAQWDFINEKGGENETQDEAETAPSRRSQTGGRQGRVELAVVKRPQLCQRLRRRTRRRLQAQARCHGVTGRGEPFLTSLERRRATQAGAS